MASGGMQHGGGGGTGNAQSIRARLVLADQLTQDGDLIQAATVYAQVAESYAAADRVQEALAIITRAQSLGDHWFTTASVGPVIEQIGEAAVPLCTRAAEQHWRCGRVGEALQFYFQATQLDPSDATALIRLAQAYQHQGLSAEAAATFVIASRRLLEQYNDADFIAVAEQLLGIDGGHADTLRDLARAYLRVGEPRRAVAKLTALMQSVPEDPVGYEILAQAFACIGKVDVALSVLTKLTHDLRGGGNVEEATDLLWRAGHWLPNDLEFLRSVNALTAETSTPEPSQDSEVHVESVREGVMMLGPEDVGTLDESGVYRDREGTNMLSLEDIAFEAGELSSRARPAAKPQVPAAQVPVAKPQAPVAQPPSTAADITTAEAPAAEAKKPMTRRERRAAAYAAAQRDAPDTDDDEPRTLLMDDSIKGGLAGAGGPATPPPASPPPAAPARPLNKPILTKQEGTIVLNLRDLAVVGASREEAVVLDVSDIDEDSPDYRLPELIIDEDSGELDVDPSDLHSVRQMTPAPPPVRPASRPPSRPAKAPRAPAAVARPALPSISSGRSAADNDAFDQAATLPPGAMRGRPKLDPRDLEEEPPTAMRSGAHGADPELELDPDAALELEFEAAFESEPEEEVDLDVDAELEFEPEAELEAALQVDAAPEPELEALELEVEPEAEAEPAEPPPEAESAEESADDPLDGLFKKRRTGRDRSASLVDKLSVKASQRARRRKRIAPQTSTAPQQVVPARGHTTVTATAPQAVIPLQPQSPAPVEQTAVAPAPTEPSPPARKQKSRKAGVRWDKPSAPKRDKPQ